MVPDSLQILFLEGLKSLLKIVSLGIWFHSSNVNFPEILETLNSKPSLSNSILKNYTKIHYIFFYFPIKKSLKEYRKYFFRIYFFFKMDFCQRWLK